MSNDYQTRAELERLHQIVVQDSIYNCPMCRSEQDNNGLIAWCENGHVYTLRNDDPRYDPK